jgi:YHS domain-containing protein
MRPLPFALLAVALSACSSSAPAPQAPSSQAPSSPAAAPGDDAKPIGEAKLGDATHCPVSGQRFVVSESTPKVEHEGKTYYFCCPECPARFKQDPQKYLNKAQAPRPATLPRRPARPPPSATPGRRPRRVRSAGPSARATAPITPAPAGAAGPRRADGGTRAAARTA